MFTARGNCCWLSPTASARLGADRSSCYTETTGWLGGDHLANIAKRSDRRWRARYRDAAGKEPSRHFARKIDA